jgi:hypothetical protein
MNVFRDPAANQCIVVPPRDGGPLEWPGPTGSFMGRSTATAVYSPIVSEMVARYRGPEALTRPVF